jgi:hypothetical protein
MAHSRFSIPLFAVGLFAIAVCMAYLIMTKNIFGFSSFNNADVTEGPLYEDGFVVGVEGDKISDGSIFDFKKTQKLIASGAKKITGAQTVDASESSGSDVLNNEGAVAVVENGNATTASNSIIIVESAQSAMSQQNYNSRLLWKKYSATIPRLYSHPRDENTEEILGRVGQLSMQLDSQGYSVQSESELIKIAVAGEREGARALSFQYMNSSLLNTTQALTWAMIANAIAPNDYYLYICSKGFPECAESAFLQAAMQAQKYINLYGFSQVQDSPSGRE